MSEWERIGKSDEWYTPKYIFDGLGCRFDMDVAAPVDRTNVHTPADIFITENSLDAEWSGFCWMNPPFGGRNAISNWLGKISEHGNGIALTPDRTSAGWWQFYARWADAVLFVSPKIKFIKPDGTTGDQPGSGTTLMAFGVHAKKILLNSKLGITKI